MSSLMESKPIARVSIGNGTAVSVAIEPTTTVQDLQSQVLEKLRTKETLTKSPDSINTCVVIWKKNEKEKPLKETCLVVDVMKQWKKKNKNGFEMKLPIGYVTPPKIERWYSTPLLPTIKRSPSSEDGFSPRPKQRVSVDGVEIDLPQGIITTERTLFVKVVEARRLPIMDITGSSDPYCVLAVENSKLRTRTIWKNHKDPFWGEDYPFTVFYPTTADLAVTVYDEDKHSRDDVIGKLTLPISMMNVQQPYELWHPLMPVFTKNQLSGELQVEILFEPPSPTSTTKKGKLRVTICQARNLSSAADAFCCIHWNEEVQKTGIVRKSVTPLWNEEFEYDNVSEASGFVRLVLWDGAKEKNVFLGQAMVHVSALGAGVPRKMWCDLMNDQDRSDKIEKKTLGEIRLRVKYVEDQVLPSEAYSELLAILMEKDLAVVSALGNITDEKEELAWTLNKIFFSKHKSLFLLKTLTTKEITETRYPYLKSTLQDLIKTIYSSKKSAELDPSKMEKSDDIKKNFNYLHSNIDAIVKKIFLSADACPLTLRELFQHLQAQVMQQYGSSDGTSSSSGDTDSSKSITPKSSEPSNCVLDMENMKKFIDTVAVPPPPNLVNPPAIEVPAIFLEKELERAHQHLRKHRDEILKTLKATNREDVSTRLDNALQKLELTKKALINKWSL